MSWIALVITLLLEQVHGTPPRNPVYQGAGAFADRVARQLNAGRPRHGAYAWVLTVGCSTLFTAAIFLAARSLGWFAGLALDVLVLFFALGFRQFSHPLTRIQTALALGDLDTARRELAACKRATDPGHSGADLDAAEIARQAVEFGVLAAQRHVFGVLFWFVLLPGPSGAVLYRMSEHLARRWNLPVRHQGAVLPPDRFGEFAARAFAWIDYLPARLTAIAFAIVGNFEAAVYCWRRVDAAAGAGVPDADDILLGSASGALGVRVVGAFAAARFFDEPGLEGAGLAEPTPDTVRQAVGLAWRAMILWLVVLGMMTLASLG